MSEYVKLLFLVVPVVALIIGTVIKLRRYDPNGDKCPHGVRGGEGFKCDFCDGRVYEVKVYTADGLVDEYRIREDVARPADLRRVP